MKLTDRTLAGRPADLAAENRELHQLRAQVAALLHACGELEQELDENVGVMNALRRQRDTAETERDEANGDRDSALQLWQQLVRQRAAVLALHAEVRVDSEGYHGCVHCGGDWPCDTRRALGATAEETA